MNRILKDIIMTEEDVKSIGYYIEDDMIESVNVNIIAHFGNTVHFEIYCINVRLMSLYHNTANLGSVIKAFVELFELSEEDGIRLSEIKNIPCRLIFDNSGRCVGFGHFMKDKFVLIDEFAEIGLEKQEHN